MKQLVNHTGRARRATVLILSITALILSVGALLFSEKSNANNYPIEITDGGPFVQNWTNTAQITTDNDWSGVVAIEGFTGAGMISTLGVDPRTVTGDTPLATKQVFANQTNPSTFTSSGVAEFQLTDPTIALKGSSTAPAPHLVIHVNTTACTTTKTVVASYTLRDIDGSANNVASPVSLQFRTGSTGAFSNISAGYVADATTGPSAATKVTNVSANLPSTAVGKPDVTLRIMMTAATAGNDEWVGVDNIQVKCSLVTGASADITGRVVDEFGRGISRARVSAFDTNSATTVYASTNQLGYFVIADQPVGDFYIIDVRHKFYTFPSSYVQLIGDVGNIVITADSTTQIVETRSKVY